MYRSRICILRLGEEKKQMRFRELMRSRAKKNSGCSWVDTGDEMCSFTAGELMKGPDDDLCHAEP